MIEVTAAINDAPMGELTFEDEVFDLQRLQDIETARGARGDRSYRVIARHRETGEIGGHTNGGHQPAPAARSASRPTPRWPGPTAVTGSACCSRST